MMIYINFSDLFGEKLLEVINTLTLFLLLSLPYYLIDLLDLLFLPSSKHQPRSFLSGCDQNIVH